VDSIEAGGFVGFVTEQDMNPFVELLETSNPVFLATCSQWYDQHISVPRGKVYNGPIWQPGINATEGEAHSGTKSIALRGPGPDQVKTASPLGGGPAIYGESSKRYRLAAWVKTKGLDSAVRRGPRNGNALPDLGGRLSRRETAVRQVGRHRVLRG